MINNKRFITEYRNYLISELEKSELSDITITAITVLANRYVELCHAGLLSINDCMYKLVMLCSLESIRGRYDG